jgi:transketolase
MMKTDELAALSRQLAVDSIRVTAAAGSGHATSSLSAADLVSVLFANHLRYDFSDPGSPHNDRFVLSKGHATPLLYSLYRAAGVINEREFSTYRRHGSSLQGHPTPALPWVDVATGSLGQGLPIGVGMAIAGKRLDKLPYRVWVLSGDSEMAEGSVWEAVECASFMGLDNLTLIIDVNRLGQRGPTRFEWDTAAYAKRLEACGWGVVTVDGHDLEEVDRAYTSVTDAPKGPTAVIARTVKGHGVPLVENRNGQHGKPIEDSEAAVEALGGRSDLRLRVARPDKTAARNQFHTETRERPAYGEGSKVATRDAYGQALAYLGSLHGDIVALDAEVSDSTRSAKFAEAHPERFFEMYIAEQQMAAAAVGMQAVGWRPFASTFSAFVTRAHDFIRMAAVSEANIALCGSHAGVSIGQDGPSQMGLEDMAMLRAIRGSTVLSPCDANQTVALAELMAATRGIRYMRTLRPETPVIYPPETAFEIGGSKTLRSSRDDQVTVIATGITVHEALKAHTELSRENISIRVIDAYSVKPTDRDTVLQAARETRAIITVEDHRPEGGLGDAVDEALSDLLERPQVSRLAVRNMPGSATTEEQLADAEIDADSIVREVRKVVASPAYASRR